MPDTLFSDFWIADPKLPSDAAGPSREESFAVSLAEALGKLLPRERGRPGSHIEPDVLATAIADIVAGRSAVLHLNENLDGAQRDAVRTFLEQLVHVAGTLDATRQEAAIARLADIILPDDLAAARGTLAADNLALRDRFIAETSTLTSAEVGERAGHRSSNPYATAARWKKTGDIFSVHHRGTEYFPAFQFRDGRPHPTIGKALAMLPASLSPWQRAFWFVSTNGWLGDKTPAEMLDDPEAVVAAARHEAQEVVG
jgi:hypothetical protein